MATRLSVLQNIQVAAPCSADWNDMTGDDRVRFCGDCQLNVYNLSAMTEDQIVGLVRETEGRLCGRFYRRRDGTILVQDCPKGLRAIVRRRLVGVGCKVGAAVVLLAGLVGGSRLDICGSGRQVAWMGEISPGLITGTSGVAPAGDRGPGN